MTIRRGGALLTVAALVATALGLVAPTPAPAQDQVAWSVPAFVRSIGGNGRPGVFPWGVQYNPVSNEVIVGDYLNNQIRRYTPDGKILGSFYRANPKGQPYSIGVDPRNGDIYVPEITDGGVANRVAHYTSNGTYVRELTLSGIDYQAWITVDGNGNLIQADSHYRNSTSNPPAVRVWRLSDGRQTRAFDVMPPGTSSSTIPRIYGVDNDAAGNFWLTDTFNNRILKYSPTGSFLAAYGAGRFHGDARGMAVDDTRNRLYVSDPTVGQVQVFDLQGNFVESLGAGGGAGPTDLGAARQPAVAPDGSLYVAEYGNARVHRFTADGADAGFFPRPAQPAVAGQLGQPRDVDVDDQTGDVWVADSWNQRFQRFRSTGEFAGTWGTRSANAQYGMNYPRGIGIDPVSRRVWVVNQRGHHIKRYEYDGTYVDTLGDAETDSSSPGFFRWPLDVEFYQGRTLVTDRSGSRAKLLDAATGVETGSIARSPHHGGAIDPDTGNIYLSDATKIYQYDPTGTQLIRSFGSSGTGDSQFRHIWDMVVSKGVLYVTDDTASRIQAFTTSGTFLGKWGGAGSGAYQFRNPSGIAADADGLIYVADASNDRVLVFDPARTRGGSWPPPDLTLGYPGSGATVPGRPVRFAGTATDETAISSVQVAVRDRDSGLWFDATNSSWSATQTWALSPLVGETSRSVTWSWGFIGIEYAGRYSVQVRAVDAAGLVSPVRSADFEVVPENSIDTDAPEAALSDPGPGASVELEPPLVLTGRAEDDTGVRAVDLRVRRAGTGLFLQPDGSFASTTAWLPAGLAEPDTTSSSWTYPWAHPEAGSYEVAARSLDVLDNSAVAVLGTFELTAVLPPDTAPPVLSQLLPAPNSTVTASGADLGGRADDDRSVAAVEVAVKNKTDNTWLRADGTWGPFGWLPATLASPGASTTTWARSWVATPGSYGYQVRARDASGNTTNQAFRSFAVR